MDHFGIGNAMRGMAIGYFCAARRTGRTTSLLESLKEGDRVVCATEKEARHLRMLIKERELLVGVIVVEPGNATAIFQHGTPLGRTVLDHGWVEIYYQQALERATRAIDHLQREASGYGTAHIETKRQIFEAAKWPR